MPETAMTYVLNFGHPLHPRVVAHLSPAREVRVPMSLDLDREQTPPQVERTVTRALDELRRRHNVRVDGTASVIVVLPGVTEGAAVLLAELHGRTGHFPRVLALRRQGDGTYGLFADSAGLGVLDLERVRQESRGRRTGLNPVPVERKRG